MTTLLSTSYKAARTKWNEKHEQTLIDLQRSTPENIRFAYFINKGCLKSPPPHQCAVQTLHSLPEVEEQQSD